MEKSFSRNEPKSGRYRWRWHSRWLDDNDGDGLSKNLYWELTRTMPIRMAISATITKYTSMVQTHLFLN